MITPQDIQKSDVFGVGKDVLYLFGETTIEVDFVKVDEVPKNHPFARSNQDETEAELVGIAKSLSETK